MADFTITLLEEKDLESAAGVFLKAFNGVGETWNKETSLAHIEENFIEGYSFLAREDETVVGILIGLPITRDKGKELFIDTVAVLPDYQNKGIGNALLEKASGLAKEKGFVALRLLASEKLASFDWYKNKDFKESGWVEVFKKL